MRTLCAISLFVFLTSCNNSNTKQNTSQQTDIKSTDTTKQISNNKPADFQDSSIVNNQTLAKSSVLVLPPYDLIANEGISPDVQKYIENIITNDTTFKLIRFPYRQLNNVPYQNIYDKKYCGSITEKLSTDFIIMSKLDHTTNTGNMTTDKWNFAIKIYNTKTGSQKISTVTANNLTGMRIKELITSRQQELFTEMKNNR